MTHHARQLERTPATPKVVDVEQHALGRSIALHLLPGVLTAGAFYLLAPVVMQAGFPAIAAGVVAAVVFVVVGELGWLLRQAHRRSGTRSWSIKEVLPFQPGPFTWRTALLAVGLFTWAVAVSLLGIGISIKESFFSWMPEWALSPIAPAFADTGNTAAGALTAIGFLVVLVILGPLVEELYFRGYLLPRIGRFGAWAPLINVSLFACYHLWKPWDVINLILVLAPMVYVVWRLRDIRVGIAVHVALNGMAWATNVAPVLLFN